MNVTVKNLSPGLQVYQNVKGKQIMVRPGDSASFDMAPFHIRMFRREAAKDNPKLEMEFAPGQEDEVKEMEKQEHQPRVLGVPTEPLFITDPKTISEATQKPLPDARGPQTYLERMKSMGQTPAPVEPKTVKAPPNPPAPSKPKAGKVERVKIDDKNKKKK